MSTQDTPSSKSGWKALAVAFVLSVLFLGIFYLAVNNEPDYMPSQQQKNTTQQHAFKTAPTMAQDPAPAEEHNSTEEHSSPEMTEAQHQQHHAASTAHSH